MPERMTRGQFFGERVKSAGVSGALLTEYIYAPGFAIPKHWHEVPYIAFVLQGAYTEIHGASKLSCKPSSVLFQSAGAVHSEAHDSGVVRFFVLQLTPEFLHRMSDCVSLPPEAEMIRSPELATLGHKLHREFRLDDSLAALAAEGYVLETMATLARHCHTHATGTPGWLITVRDIIHDHFPVTPPLSWIGKQVNIHPAHMSRAFRRHFNLTIGEYARQLCVDRARVMLTQPDQSLADIAASLGDSDQSHFSNMFKRYTGFTPGSYRKLMRSR